MPQRRTLLPRFWHPHGSLPPLDFDGYLADPEKAGRLAPNLFNSAEIAKHQCLVLLGEPGMGKSTALREIYETEKAQAAEGRYMFVNLAQFTTDIALLRD